MSTDLPHVDPANREVRWVPVLAGEEAEGDSDGPDALDERILVGCVKDLPSVDHRMWSQDGLVISSQIRGGPQGHLHAPVIDLDLPAMLVPSATPGHHHLYLDVGMPWDDLVKLLNVMAEVGLVQPGYVAAAIARGATDVRAYPHTKRRPAPEPAAPGPQCFRGSCTQESPCVLSCMEEPF